MYGLRQEYKNSTLKIFIMSDFKNIESSIEENSNISKKNRTSALSYLYAVIGACAIAATFAITMNSSASFAIIFLGIIFLIIGLAGIFRPKKFLCYTPTNEEVKEHIYYFDAKDKKAVYAAVESGDLNLVKLIRSGSTNMRAIVYATPSKEFIVMQMQTYIPHEYVPVEEPKVITLNGNTSQSN